MSRRRRSRSTDDEGPRIPIAERLLVEQVPTTTADGVLCTTRSRGAFAEAYASARPDGRVTCHFLDLFLADRARETLAGTPNAKVVCEADLPTEPIDLAAFPVGRNDEAELTRDMLQEAYERLGEGGRLLAAVDNPRDSWLHDELRKLFPKVTRSPAPEGVLYSAVKRGPLKRRREFGCEFAFRDRGNVVKVFSRPGVFSHRRVDAGARALLEVVEVESGDRVLDLGCGAGVVALALASRADGIRVTAIDSNPRALACTLRGAELNGLTTIDTRLDADATVEEPRSYQLVVGNPPYFSKYAIAEVFVAGAERAVAPGGLVAFVTRQAAWFAERMNRTFDDVGMVEVRDYAVVVGTGR